MSVPVATGARRAATAAAEPPATTDNVHAFLISLLRAVFASRAATPDGVAFVTPQDVPLFFP